MAGFPGESDAEFEEGLAFVAKCAFDGMHVFQYSRRSGTAASSMDGHLAERVKKERSARLRVLAQAGQQELARRHVGGYADVVWESHKDGVWRGISDTNIRVYSSDSHLGPGLVERRYLSSTYREGAWAEGVLE
jgi:threonylcarbamoyladenosine tRNA methylthiotransferase MtaB